MAPVLLVSLIGTIKDAKLNGKPVLVKYLVGDSEVESHNPSYIANGFLTEIVDEDNRSVSDTIDEDIEKSNNDINVTQIEADYEAEETIKEEESSQTGNGLEYVMLFESVSPTSGDTGLSLTLTNPENRYTNKVIISMKKPAGLEIHPSQGCYGSGKCELDSTKGRLEIIMTPWSATFDGPINIQFRSSGALTNDVKAALISNGENKKATKISYKRYLTVEDYEKNLAKKADPVPEENEDDSNPTATPKVAAAPKAPETPKDFSTLDKIDHNDSKHFAVGYLASWNIPMGIRSKCSRVRCC